MDDDEVARTFTGLFSSVYLRFHRKKGARDRLTSQQWAVLQHLSMTGPLTIGECAKHLERAQSVVSEIVDGLEHHGLVERMRDARDKRRVLVWLSDEALTLLERERQVLDTARLARALARLSPADKRALLQAMDALVQAAPTPRSKNPEKKP